MINVAARLGIGELTRVTRDQIFAWDPAIIIAQQPGFYTALQRDRAWRGLAASRQEADLPRPGRSLRVD